MKKLALLTFTAALTACSGPAEQTGSDSQTQPQKSTTTHFDMYLGGTDVGDMDITRTGNKIDIDYGFSNNGRGASSIETIILSDNDIPLSWSVEGKTVFGNATQENFSVSGNTATWQSKAESGEAGFDGAPVYIAQNGSPFSEYLYALPLLNDNLTKYPALPSGHITLSKKQDLTLSATGGEIKATLYAIGGISMNPSYFIIDENKALVGLVSPRTAIVKPEIAGEEARLRELTAQLNAQRYKDIASRYLHDYEKPVRINNVRIFEPQSLSLSEPKSVVITGNKITAVEAVSAAPSDDEVTIEGNGGTLVAGLYEMHGHMSDNDALLNVLAGVTSVRDMGNEVDILQGITDNIANGILVGPRIAKSGFIEGKSPFSNSTGELAASEDEAVELVRKYAGMDDYIQIKIYSSVNPEWVPAMAKEAHENGLRVAGHIPAFAKADEMIAAGYNEITHINQLMLGWVLDRKEDTRTLFRITGMKRFTDLDLNSDQVNHTLALMKENNIALDPTTVIHEHAMTSRNGTVSPGVVDYIDHMPLSSQRAAKVAMLNVADEAEDKAYKDAFAKIVATLKKMHENGILLVPGTDMGGAFRLHRELELFQQFGMAPAEALKRGSWDMAVYMGHDDKLGSIETGKLADFFLIPGNPVEDLKAIKTIAMVVADGRILFPDEVYPEFGISPFTTLPEVKGE